MNDKEFFETQVFRPETNCWIWRAYVGRNGYGGWHRHGRPEAAHRKAYKLFVGPIAPGLEVHHKCFNRICVNPDHLVLVTKQEHNEIRRSTHCRRGHLRTPENTYELGTRGGKVRRRCRQCDLERLRKPGGWKDPNRQRGTHCPQGHEYTPENTYTYARGGQGGYRYCRECNRAAARKISKRRG